MQLRRSHYLLGKKKLEKVDKKESAGAVKDIKNYGGRGSGGCLLPVATGPWVAVGKSVQ